MTRRPHSMAAPGTPAARDDVGPAPSPGWQASLRRNPSLWMFALWAFLLCIFPIRDTDLWWHLKTGEQMIARGEIPRLDWYTYTDSDKAWIDLHWGFQLFAYGVYSLGGNDLLIVLKALVYALAMVVALHAARPARSDQAFPAALHPLVWIPAAIGISGRALERPEMFSLLYLAGVLWILRDVEEHPRRLWLLPPLFLVWVNMHALFALGLVVWVLFTLDLSARRLLAPRFGLRPLPELVTVPHVLAVTALIAVAVLANPYFLDGALFPLTLWEKFSTQQDFYSVRVAEFQRPLTFFARAGFRNLYFDAQCAAFALAWLSTVGLWTRGRFDLFRFALLGAYSQLALEASRNVSPFCLVAAYVTAANIRQWCELRLAAQGQPLSSTTDPDDAPSSERWVTLALILGSVLVVTGVWNELGERNKPFSLGEAPNWAMHEAARFAGQSGMPDYAFVSHNGQAAVYTYHNYPNRLVFMDPRLEVMTRQTFEKYEAVQQAMARGDGTWTNFVRGPHGELPVVLLDSRGSRALIEGMLHTPGWRLVFADTTGAVFLDEPTATRLGMDVAPLEPLVIPPQD